MENIYANPVGIINKKDIYIIINNINNKVYVGQSKNAAIRFKQHCKSCNLDNSLIGKAIKKYGKQNFAFKILERQIVNYNEREDYWIEFYNSKHPNGYNILSGGGKPPTLYGEESPNCKLSNDELNNLIDDLINTKISYGKLATKYKISKRQVMRINCGVSRYSDDITYPIRKTPNINGKLDDSDVDLIIELLQYTYFLNGTIARMFGVGVHAISRINSGKSHFRNYIDYPIREWKSCGVINLTYEQVTEIIELLKNTDLSMNKISKRYGINIGCIQMINNGSSKKYRRKEIIYPIRNY